MRRFEQESRAVAALNHPNVLSIFDTGTHDGIPYLVSELLEGESLTRELYSKTWGKASAGTLDVPPDSPPILEQVVRAKQEAEAKAILAALNSTHWNRKQAAMLLKIDYKALLYKIRRLGLTDDSAVTEAAQSDMREAEEFAVTSAAN